MRIAFLDSMGWNCRCQTAARRHRAGGLARAELARLLTMLAAVIVLGGAPPASGNGSHWPVAVAPLSAEMFQPRPPSERARRLIQGYYDSILSWGRIVAGKIEPAPGHAEWGYFGLRGHTENDVRPTAYAALVAAFLARFQPPGGDLDEGQRRRMHSCATATLRYLVASHGASGGACLDGKPWGGQWQSALWARAAGMAGWILWPDLDAPMRESVVRVIESEADRFVQQPPKSSEFRDTGAEENAWNASILALASNMLPGHPHARDWDRAAKRYMYNSLSVAADREDESAGDDRQPIRQWVTTINAHPDFTLENHGLVHVGYLKLTVAELQENAIHYVLGQAPVPRACSHHVPEAWNVLLRCMAWDGSPVFFGGDDWKTFHCQCSDILLFAMRSLLASDRRAAYLEEVALDWLLRIQRHEGGYYNVRRDLEFGGLCATRLVAGCLAHAALGEGAEPIGSAQFNREASGVTYLPFGRAILHRTADRFASFSWGNKVMAVVMPENGTWVVWPHFSSMLGAINGQDASPPKATTENLQHQAEANSFRVTGTIRRFGGKVLQDFLFTSLEQDAVVYVERLRVEEGFRIESRETGIVGHDYELGSNQRDLYGSLGTKRVTGLGGSEQVIEMETDWLNLGNRIGYVIRRWPETANVVRYHDFAQGSGRVPQLQEWLSLVSDRSAAAPLAGDRWACVVVLPNQSSDETRKWKDRVTFRVEGNSAACGLGDQAIRVDFAPRTRPR